MDGGGGGTEIQKGLEVERWGISNLTPTRELSMGPFIYVFAGKMFSKQVLGTRAFRLRTL